MFTLDKVRELLPKQSPIDVTELVESDGSLTEKGAKAYRLGILLGLGGWLFGGARLPLLLILSAPLLTRLVVQLARGNDLKVVSEEPS